MQKVVLQCACGQGCGESLKVDAREDMSTKKLVPLQVHPYISLSCWLAGWRHDGPQADGTYRIFNVGRAESPRP